MGEGIKVGGYNPIIIDDVEFKDILNLSTKWQWVDDIGSYPAAAEKLVLLKNKIHLISSYSNNYRLEDDGVVQDVSLGGSNYTPYWFCSDGDNIYYVKGSSSSSKYNQVWKFDGTANTRIFEFTSAETGGFSYMVSGANYTAVDKVKKRLYFVFETKNRTSSTNVSYSSIHGYLDLQTLEFVNIAEHPDPDEVTLFMYQGELYSQKKSIIYKYNENENSWTQISSGTPNLYLVQGQEDKDVIYAFSDDIVYKFDGTNLERDVTTPFHKITNSIFKDNIIHSFGTKYIGLSTSDNIAIGYQHQVLKKVLCLEV